MEFLSSMKFLFIVFCKEKFYLDKKEYINIVTKVALSWTTARHQSSVTNSNHQAHLQVMHLKGQYQNVFETTRTELNLLTDFS